MPTTTNCKRICPRVATYSVFHHPNFFLGTNGHQYHHQPVIKRSSSTTKSSYSLFLQYGYHASIQQRKQILKTTRHFMAASSSSSSSGDGSNKTATKASRPTQKRRNFNNQIQLRNSNNNINKNNKKRRNNGDSNFKAAIERNKKIISFGKQRRWKEILQLYQYEKDDFNNVNYATVMSQFQRMGWKLDRRDRDFLQFVDDLAEKIQSRGLDWIGIQGIANIVHSIGKMGLRSKSAKLIIQFASDTNNASDIVSGGVAQALANICWSMAKLGDTDSFSSFFVQLEPHLERFLEHSDPQNLANTAWACATLGVQSPNLFTIIEQRSTWIVKEGTPQAVANLAWACATLGVQSPNLFTIIEKSSTWLVKEGTPQNLANTAWACATLGIKSPKLFDEIEQRSSWLVEEGTPQNLANTAWALATMGIRSDAYFRCFLQNVMNFLSQAEVQQVINSCFAISVLDLAAKNEEKFKILWSEALSLTAIQCLNGLQWAQLAQSYAFVSASGVLIEEPMIPPTVVLKEPKMSRSQIEVSDTLKDIGFHNEQEVCPYAGDDVVTKKWSDLPQGMLAIDIACRERMIAIEFDGPSHFLLDVPSGEVSNVENGATKAKRLFLERLGWNVINIHYLDWIKAKSKEAKQSMLRSKLNLVDPAC